MLKRTPFKHKAHAPWVKPEREHKTCGALTRPFNGARFDKGITAIPKEAVCRSEAYRRLVAAMPCAHCHRPGPSQAAHSDQGKGAHIKADDRTCYPLCATSPGRVGCHDTIGASGTYTRDERRTLEAQYAAETRTTIIESGNWPAGLPTTEQKGIPE